MEKDCSKSLNSLTSRLRQERLNKSSLNSRQRFMDDRRSLSLTRIDIHRSPSSSPVVPPIPFLPNISPNGPSYKLVTEKVK